MTLRWVLPTERVDGTPLPPEELATLTLHAGRIPMAQPGELVYTMDVDPHVLSWQLFDQPLGVWFFTATITDTNGLTSDQSNEAMKDCG